MTPRSLPSNTPQRALGYTLPEVMMAMAGILLMSLAVYWLFFSGTRTSDAATVALAVDDLRADMDTQFAAQPSYAALQSGQGTQSDIAAALKSDLGEALQRGEGGSPGTSWGPLTWMPVARPCHADTPSEGCQVAAGGYQLALSGVPGDACSTIATHYLQQQQTSPQETTWIDGVQQVSIDAALSACAVGGAHTVTWQHWDYTKPGI